MLNKELAILIDVGRPGGNPPVAGNPSAMEFHAIQRFSDELASKFASPVPIFTRPSGDFSSLQAILFFSEFDIRIGLQHLQEQHPELLKKVIAVPVNRANIYETMQQFQLAGAVEIHDQYLWQEKIRGSRSIHLYGITAICNKIGATELITQGDYCMFRGDDDDDLISLLCRYISGL
jgi:hypothetical protein